MQLSALAEDIVCGRDWLVVAPETALKCVIDATRYYAGYGDIASLTGLPEQPGAPGAGGTAAAAPDGPVPDGLPLRNLRLVKENTVLTAGEWAIIRPLALLYLERERAQLLELSRSAAVEPAGRSSSEVAQDIRQAEEAVQSAAFSSGILTI